MIVYVIILIIKLRIVAHIYILMNALNEIEFQWKSVYLPHIIINTSFWVFHIFLRTINTV